ncbi:MarR family winged helix-turn-helix transcriptional regulator [Janibacter endophyticus]|uniref:MarR family winged helix-turn-helix transcriptional regulator n=1 Tax=Janibacter endophyticus TaxID=2806261 RepID=UPI0027DE8765|nr:MarR family transcriptional regulator [Janibacter endophyticus]
MQVAGAVPGAMARRAGLSYNEIAVLDLLSDHPRGPGEIARSLAVTSAAASGIIDRLVARGYAVRGPHPQDRRRTVVEISESGRAEIVGHLMPMITQLAALDDDLSERDREVVLRYLTDATAAIHRLL